jgi:predicted amidophosphoribosyltransferase
MEAGAERPQDPSEAICPDCGRRLGESRYPLCEECDERFERALALWLEYVAAARAV